MSTAPALPPQMIAMNKSMSHQRHGTGPQVHHMGPSAFDGAPPPSPGTSQLPFVQVGLLFSLFLIVIGVMWFFVIMGMTHPENPGFSVAILGVVAAALGALLFAIYLLRALRDSKTETCPFCDEKYGQAP